MNTPTPRTDAVIDACVAANESTATLCRKLGNLCGDLERQCDAMATAIKSAIECGMIPPAGCRTTGSKYYDRQNEVADMLRDALAEAKGGES